MKHMHKKGHTFFKIFTGILLIIAIFFRGIDTRIFLALVLFGLIGTLLLALLPKISVSSLSWKPKIHRHSQNTDDDDPVQAALLCQFSHRITDKLRSAYPQALWDWEKQPDVQRILSGKSNRICLKDAAEYTHAEVNLDTYGSIHLQLLKIQELSRSQASEATKKEPPVNCDSWYELVGENVLNQIITDLNARGYESLSINENGDVFITENDTPIVKDHFQNFPGKKHWTELIAIFQKNELQAQETDNVLVLTWGK